jgi:hypothetical protein
VSGFFFVGVAFPDKHKQQGKAPMPVLDAKALEIDPKGMNFLKSILRPLASSEVTPKDHPRVSRIRFHMPRRVRVAVAGTA